MPENSRQALLNGAVHKLTLDTALRMAVLMGSKDDRSMLTQETEAWGLEQVGLAAPMTRRAVPFPRGIPRKGVNASATTAHVRKATSLMDIAADLGQRCAAHSKDTQRPKRHRCVRKLENSKLLPFGPAQ